MKIYIKNTNETLQISEPKSFAEILKDSSIENKKEFYVVKFNNTLLDLTEKTEKEGELEFLNFQSEEGREAYRHTSSHIMAQAVVRLFPDAKLAIGPAIQDGFYYDFDVEHPFQEEDLEKIEQEIKKIIKDNLPIKKNVLSKEEALKLFQGKNEPYKIELIRDIPDQEVSLYSQGEFTDLCRGPHLQSTGRVKIIKLLKISGAYWRGDEKNKMLQRIYGVSFESKEDLEQYLEFLKESEARDHRKLGKQLDIFSVQESAGPGLIYWHPNGAMIRHNIENFWRSEHLKHDYQLIYSPHIAKIDLWKTSGHWENYRENIYSPIDIDEQQYLLKPMNCPGHILIYKSHLRSYRELPIRWAELGTVYRYERSGTLHGTLRVRGFTQDDAHIFCREDQLAEEIQQVLKFVFFILDKFGFKSYKINLSTRPEKFTGTEESWQKATDALRKALELNKLDFGIDEGGGVFYGPKIDIQLIDALGRGWQGPTIQVDFNLPQRFNVTYIGQDGKEHQPVMIHRALLGSFERFLGILIEHYKGAFPLWLAPVQVAVITISDKQINYAKNIEKKLKEGNIRVELDISSEKMGNKIREAITRKIPYLFIIGEKEAEKQMVSIRTYKEGDQGIHQLDAIINKIKNDIENKII